MTGGRIGTAIMALAAAGWLTGCRAPQGERPAPGAGAGLPSAGSARGPAQFVGRSACAGCHPAQTARYTGSDHDLAMQPAEEGTVPGDFHGATFTYHGVTSTFFRRDGRFMVRTDGPDGAPHDYEIAYTFGHRPLQQYLIAFPGGRYQALNVCWDSRPKSDGGQRWFHLYPGTNVTHRDAFHWTGPYQNWNFMCAECHSTNLKKRYREEEDRYETAWSEIDVSCEACHGPGSLHVAWGEAVGRGKASRSDRGKGLVADLADPGGRGAWRFGPGEATARRSPPRVSSAEVEACARCHSRRGVLVESYSYGRPLLDTHRPALLEARLYFADGQIEDEVYEYASFLQSRMAREGVSCTDCHDPHSLRLADTADAVCAGCHARQKFEPPAHHFHPQGSPGASCVACHMPARDYMVVDARRDHSFRIPRPDLAERTGAPAACGGCHRDRPPGWAAEAASRWWPDLARRPQYGLAIEAGRAGLPGAEGELARLASAADQPGIVRATALALLERHLSPVSVPVLEGAVRDGEALVRFAVPAPARVLPPEQRLALLAPLLSDPVRGVRIEAARALVSARHRMDALQRKAYEAALSEFMQAQAAQADRAEGHLNLGTLERELGNRDGAEREYRRALALNRFLPATYLALADLYRESGDEPRSEETLRAGLEIDPENADLHRALGLALVRSRRTAAALRSLARASALEPGDSQHAYAYGVALHDFGQPGKALEVLREAHRAHPGDRDILFALVSYSRESGALAAARDYARRLVELAPGDRLARQLLEQLPPPAR